MVGAHRYLTPRARRSLGLTLVAIAVAVPGCGGGSEPDYGTGPAAGPAGSPPVSQGGCAQSTNPALCEHMTARLAASWQQQQAQLAAAQQQPNTLIPTVQAQVETQRQQEQQLKALQLNQALADFYGDRAAFAQKQAELIREQRERDALLAKQLEDKRYNDRMNEQARLRGRVDDAFHWEKVLGDQASTDNRRRAQSDAISGGAN